MSDYEKNLIDRCIESHYNMIRMHRRAIIELSRKTIKERELCEECFDFDIINARTGSRTGGSK